MRMNHLIVQPHPGNLSTIRIVDSATVIRGIHMGWELKTGKQILWANTRMATVLKSTYLMGSFATKAVYGFTYQEMCAIMTSNLGLSDYDKYLEAMNGEVIDRQKIYETKVARRKKVALVGTELGIHAGWYGLHIFWCMVKLLFFIIVFPFVIMFFRK